MFWTEWISICNSATETAATTYDLYRTLPCASLKAVRPF